MKKNVQDMTVGKISRTWAAAADLTLLVEAGNSSRFTSKEGFLVVDSIFDFSEWWGL